MAREFATTSIAKWSTVAARFDTCTLLKKKRCSHLPSTQSSAPPWGDREETHPSASRHTKRPSTIASTVINTVAHSLTRPRVATYHRRRSATSLFSFPSSFASGNFTGGKRSARARAHENREERKNVSGVPPRRVRVQSRNAIALGDIIMNVL